MKSAAVFVLALTSLMGVEARMRWPERDGRPIVSRIMSRKVGNEHPASLTELASACDGGTCGTLAGKCVSSLLAAADPCAQQDCADEMIDVALAQTDPAVQQNIINIAIEFRQAEKNTQPDFRVQPPVDRFSIFCLKAPKHEQLNGLVQAQDSNANPLLFADPKSTTNGTTVLKGTARNTCPFTSNDCTIDTVIPVNGGLVNGSGTGEDTTTGNDTTVDTGNNTAVDTGDDAADDTDDEEGDCVDDETDNTASTSVAAVATSTSASPAAETSTAASTTGNLQTFTGALGGKTAPAVIVGGRGFQVEGNDDFLNIGAALGRSCDVQHNQCANVANSGGQSFNVGDCDQQNNECHAAINPSNTGSGAVATTSAAAVASKTSAAAAATQTASSGTGATAGNLQTFTGNLGGLKAPPVTAGGKGFIVENNDQFLNIGAALGRSCDVQHNQCANLANSGGQSFNVGDCDTQNNQCHAAISAKRLRRRSFGRWM